MDIGVQRTSAYVSIRQHTSAYVSIRQHTSAYVSQELVPCGGGFRRWKSGSTTRCARALRRRRTSRRRDRLLYSYISIRRIRQHTSAYVSGRQPNFSPSQPPVLFLRTSAYASIHHSAHVSTRQHTSAYLSCTCASTARESAARRLRAQQGWCTRTCVLRYVSS